MNRFNLILIGMFFVCLFWIFSFVSAQEIPSFHQFYGNIPGAPDGIIVKAYVNGIFVGQGSVVGEKYGYDEPFFVSGTVDDSGIEIKFYVNEVFSKNYSFIVEGLSELNLSYVIPSTPSVDNGGNIGGGGGGGSSGSSRKNNEGNITTHVQNNINNNLEEGNSEEENDSEEETPRSNSMDTPRTKTINKILIIIIIVSIVGIALILILLVLYFLYKRVRKKRLESYRGEIRKNNPESFQ